MEKEKFINEFINLGKSHNADVLRGEDDAYVTILKCNVPTLADVRMLADKFGIGYENVESSDSWGYISVYLDEVA